MLKWFRRKRHVEETPSATGAAEQEQAPPLAGDAPEQDGDDQPRKRRRGSRGGRGRKKQTDSPAPRASAAKAPERDGAKSEPERKTPRADRKSDRQRSSTRRRTAPRRQPLPQAKRELLVSVDVGEQRVAVLEDDRVAEVYLERPERRSIAGNIYKGVVDNVLPGMEAAFVEIGLEKNGFLYVDEIVAPELEGKRHGKKIQDLLSRGQDILVQAVKDPMKTKGARLTTEISLPGRFIVYVPNGEGIGVSRRLEDEERVRLRDILKALNPKEGGVIVRTAAEGASAEDIERDLVFLQRLWKTIQARAKSAKAPALIYQEAELPLRVIRDLFTGDFERAVIDHERTHKRVVGYLKKTSPHMVERVHRYRERPPLFEAYGVDAEIRSTLSRRVDLPSGGYLVFDYAEAFTVIDVNTGRFVGSRSKTSTARLEDTITKNNLEAVKEVVRQLRLRDIGGIIVIDFIDMANPKNRATVEEALKAELERDRTKTYVVEISPLGLVEMTRQNVTDGPREILTRKCPTCAGDGIVVSEASAAVDLERRLRALASGSRNQAFRVEINAHVASVLVGPGAKRLKEIEDLTKRRFYLVGREGAPMDHFVVLDKGSRTALTPAAPVAEGDVKEIKLVELGLHDVTTGVGKLDGYDVCVANAAKLVGRKTRVRIERVLDGTAYATLVDAPGLPQPPITAESEAEKPTRAPRTKKDVVAEAEAEAEPEDAVAAEAAVEQPGEEPVAEDAEERPKKRTRRGTRGGRGRKRKTVAEAGAAAEDEEAAAADGNGVGEPEHVPAPVIHLPERDLGVSADGAEPEPADAEPEPVAANGDEPAKPTKKKTRRGTRGGRNRRKKADPVAVAEPAADGDAAPALEAPPEPDEAETPATEATDWRYVPMSEWEDELSRE